MKSMKNKLILLVLLAFWVSAPLLAEDGDYFQSADGMNVYIGILPAEMVKDHRIVHQGREGIGTREQHLVVTLVDQASGQRIEDAKVAGRLRHEGHASEFLPLEPMEIADTITYGNFFSLPEEGAYSLQLRIERTGEPTTEVEFRHRHVQ
ncbi:hypothetical protein KZO25_03115 [Halomonas sp. ANAO-440]|uniref:hypothetical protein n=1 Tax=Halomonas sp. ANAO-440 TaxID=2861360 RepID=UPI001CAA7D55|nr:hypothetical protein [Halomonas sp. ANAO-440]MBZ0329302.1 hypothetical protein [Halomonas sp. ANAO-440]